MSGQVNDDTITGHPIVKIHWRMGSLEIPLK